MTGIERTDAERVSDPDRTSVSGAGSVDRVLERDDASDDTKAASTDGGRRTITVQASQRRPVLGDVERNAEVVERAIEAASDESVDLLVFPELFLTGYHVGKRDPASLVADADRALDRLAAEATDLTVVVGTPVAEDGTYYNAAVVLDRGERVGTYHKSHLYGDEAGLFAPGSDFPVFETSAGVLGVQVCYDVEFPEVSRQLTLAGAEILVTPLANMHPFEHDQHLFGATRALENVRPHVVCNRIGEEEGVDFFGASGIVDERGRSIVSAGERTTVDLTATVELGAEGADTLRYLEDRRPEIYANADGEIASATETEETDH